MSAHERPHDDRCQDSNQGRRAAPRNHQFDDVRAAWEKDFDKAHLPPRSHIGDAALQPGSASSATAGLVEFSQLPARKRARVLTLLDRRAAIEGLSSTQAQRTGYFEWLLAESQRRPGQTISGRNDDPRILPTSTPVTVARRTALYEFDMPPGIDFQRGNSVRVAIDGHIHPAVVHSTATDRVTLALADVNRRSIADAALILENSVQLGVGDRVRGRYRYVFAMRDPLTLAPGSLVEFRGNGVQTRGEIVLLKDKTGIVETSSKLPPHTESGVLHEVRYWEDYYTRIRELRHTTFGRKFSHTTITELWENFPDSKAGKFMRAVSRPLDYCFPHLDPDGKMRPFFTRAFFDHCSLLPYLVSPDRLPSKLLSDVKLVEWPQERLNAQRVLEIKAAPQVIDGFKMLFEAARWLRPGERRILVVEAPLEGTRRNYPRAQDIDQSIVGSLLYLREKVPGGLSPGARTNFEPEPIAIQFFPTVYEAYRRNPHANERYESELAQQVAFHVEVQDINERITLYWKSDQATKDDLTEELNSFAERWANAFGSAEHRLKQELHNLLRDISDRIPNIKHRIGAIQAKLVASGNRARSRSEELPDIQGTMAIDEKLLKGVIEHGESQIALIRKRLVEAAPIFEQSQAQLFDVGREESAQRAVVRSFLAKTRLNLSGLDGARCRPFVVFADKLRQTFADFERALLTGDKSSANDCLVKLLVITKLAHTNSVFEELKFRVSFDLTVTFAQLLKSATDLQGLLLQRTVLPGHIVESYRTAYEQTEGDVAQLVKGFKHYLSRGLDLEARQETYRRVRKFLDNIDIELRIRSL